MKIIIELLVFGFWGYILYLAWAGLRSDGKRKFGLLGLAFLGVVLVFAISSTDIPESAKLFVGFLLSLIILPGIINFFKE